MASDERKKLRNAITVIKNHMNKLQETDNDKIRKLTKDLFAGLTVSSQLNVLNSLNDLTEIAVHIPCNNMCACHATFSIKELSEDEKENRIIIHINDSRQPIERKAYFHRLSNEEAKEFIDAVDSEEDPDSDDEHGDAAGEDAGENVGEDAGSMNGGPIIEVIDDPNGDAPTELIDPADYDDVSTEPLNDRDTEVD